jgi:hypothetical protein
MYFTQTVRVFWPKNPDVAMQIAKPSAEWRLGQGHQKEGPGLSQLTKAGNDWRDVLANPSSPSSFLPGMLDHGKDQKKSCQKTGNGCWLRWQTAQPAGPVATLIPVEQGTAHCGVELGQAV